MGHELKQESDKLSTPAESESAAAKLASEAQSSKLTLRQASDRDWVSRFVGDPREHEELGGIKHEKQMEKNFQNFAQKVNAKLKGKGMQVDFVSSQQFSPANQAGHDTFLKVNYKGKDYLMPIDVHQQGRVKNRSHGSMGSRSNIVFGGIAEVRAEQAFSVLKQAIDSNLFLPSPAKFDRFVKGVKPGEAVSANSLTETIKLTQEWVEHLRLQPNKAWAAEAERVRKGSLGWLQAVKETMESSLRAQEITLKHIDLPELDYAKQAEKLSGKLDKATAKQSASEQMALLQGKSAEKAENLTENRTEKTPERTSKLSEISKRAAPLSVLLLFSNLLLNQLRELEAQ